MTQLEFGEQLKERGIEKVSHGREWHNTMIGLIMCVPSGSEVTSESIRSDFNHVGFPHHPNGWGAVLNSAARKGLIKKTGQWIKSTIPSTHARMIPVWVRL